MTGLQRRSFEVNHHRFVLKDLESPLRIVQLSDLHFGLYVGERRLEAWVEAALAATPDLIVITGDFVDRLAWQETTALFRQLRKLNAPLGVWGVWGNHDYAQAATSDAFVAALSHAGVRLLVNEGVRLRDDLFLAGVDDFLEGRPSLSLALEERPPLGACILLSHNPDILPRVPARVGLTLCGHTHGGQIKLPVVGALRTSSRYGKRFLEGRISEPVPAFVSRGLGYSALPLRVLSPAEIVVLELVPDD